MCSATFNMEEQPSSEERDTEPSLLYGIDERPPWYLLLLLSFQQFLLSAISFIANPIILAGPLCLADDLVGMGEFLSTAFFVGGLGSLLQTTFGVRLPIIQGPSAAFISPIIALMQAKDRQCPDFNTQSNATLPFQAGSEEHKSVWKSNLAEVQGAVLLASLVEVVVGFSGTAGVLVRYIGPLTTGTVMTLIGMSLSVAAPAKGASHWWICFMTIFLIILFSQHLKNVAIPFFGGIRIKIFLLLPVLLGIGISWFVCMVLTETDILPTRKGQWGYEARTDIKTGAITNTEWFRLPYPGQWGTPTISAGGVIGMTAAIFASLIESIGDYHACARLCRLPPPPGSAISRGLGMEGLCCVLSGAWGTGSGLTSYSANIASVGLTKVGSRVVIQLAAAMLVVVGCVGKVGALFSTVPDPIIGGMIFVAFGMVTSMGIANLESVDLRSTRNLFVFGFSVFFGFSVPGWVAQNGIDVGNDTANQVLTVFCSTGMLIGGVVSFVLDNTIPGTLKERGLSHMDTKGEDKTHNDGTAYDLPCLQSYLNRIKCLRYIPFCPGFVKDNIHREQDQIICDLQSDDNIEVKTHSSLKDRASFNGIHLKTPKCSKQETHTNISSHGEEVNKENGLTGVCNMAFISNKL